MQFASPTSLLWLLLALPLIALFLLRVKPRRMPVATVMFWHEAIPDSKPRKWWQRLRDPLMLLLQLVVLALLALALGEPRWPDGFTPPQTLIVLIDTSSSMRASSDGLTRLDDAKRKVLQTIRGLRPEDRMALIDVSSQPSIIHGLASPSRLLRLALKQVEPSDGAADFAAAAKLVDALATHRDDVRVICVSDASGQSQAPEIFDGHAEWWIIGRPISNTAITQFQVRRPWGDRMDVEVLIELQHFPIEGTPDAASGTLRIELNEALVDVVPWSLDASTPWRSVQRYRDVPGGIMTVVNSINDVFRLDDKAYASLAPMTPRKIWLVGPQNIYLQGVLAALPMVEVEIKADVPEIVPDDTVLIIYETDVSKLPQGKVMVIQPTVLPKPWSVSSSSSAEWIVPPEEAEPLLSHGTFRDVLAQGVRRLQVPDDARVLLQAGLDTPVYVHWRGAETEMFVLNVTLVDGDFVWRSLFPLLIARAIEEFNRGEDSLISATAAGHTATLPAAVYRDLISLSGPNLTLQAPDGQSRPLAIDASALASNEPVVLGRLDQIGLWQVRSTEPRDESELPAEPTPNVAESRPLSMTLPCNLVDAQESDLRATGTATEADATSERGGHPIWYLLVVLALVVSAVEWWLYQRRWIG